MQFFGKLKVLRPTLGVIFFIIFGSISCDRPKNLNEQIYKAFEDKPELRKKDCLAEDRFFWDENGNPKQRGGGCYLKTFEDYCEDKNEENTEEQQLTVDAIKSLFPGVSCNKMKRHILLLDYEGDDNGIYTPNIEEYAFIDLSNLGLSDLSPLISLPIGKLDLRGNEITDIWHLSAIAWPNNFYSPFLNEIYLDDNPISRGEVELNEKNCPTLEKEFVGQRLMFKKPESIRSFCRIARLDP